MIRHLLLVLWLTCSPALADISLTFETDPPATEIVPERRGAVQGEEAPSVGRAGEVVIIPVPPGQSTVTVELRHPDCEPLKVTLEVSQYESGLNSTWPETGGAAQLKYRSQWGRIAGLLSSWRGTLLGLGGLVGVVLAVLIARALGARRAAHRERERYEKITRLSAHGADHDEMIEAELGGYRLLQMLGRGGMARVYRAVPDASLDTAQVVAIKVMDPDLAHDQQFVRRFNHERQAYEKLNHPNIIRVYGSGNHEGRYFLVMEFLTGKNLRETLPEKGLPPHRMLELMRPLMQALAYAHEHEIVHRDLKPENVMLTDRGTLKVMDFGLAKGQQFSTVTATGALLGTPAYMAPEQIQGDPSYASDQYALGIMAYEMLTGKPPFHDDNPMTIILNHLGEAPPPLTEHNPKLGLIWEVISKMLAKDPAARYPDLKQALLALEKAVLRTT